jgi:hypothetical protein
MLQFAVRCGEEAKVVGGFACLGKWIERMDRSEGSTCPERGFQQVVAV